MKLQLASLGVLLGVFAGSAEAQQIHIVAIGDSNLGAPGVARDQTYPAQLERALRSRGLDVTVKNAGINGDTTNGVLARLDRDVPNGTDLAIVSVGINDIIEHGSSEAAVAANVKTIDTKLRARGLEVIVLPTGQAFQGSIAKDPKYHVEGLAGATGPTPGKTNWHLTPEGYGKVVQATLPTIIAAIERAKKKHTS